MAKRDERGRLVEVHLVGDDVEHPTVGGTLLDIDEERGVALIGAHAPEGWVWTPVKADPVLGDAVRYRPDQVAAVYVVTSGRRIW
jgi:hypothetical protein